MSHFKKIASIFSGIFLLSAFLSTAQSQEQQAEEKSLVQNYKSLIEGSETFQEYKVVPRTKVNSFEKQLVDTIESYQNRIAAAEIAKRKAEQKADSLKEQANLLTEELEQTQEEVDAILFFGIPMTKTGYNVLLWTIVAILVIGLVLVYIMYLNSNRVTKQSKQDKIRLDEELEDLRRSSHEKQVKIKRELQTALNKLEEQNR